MQTPLSVKRIVLLVLMSCLGLDIFFGSMQVAEAHRLAFASASNGFFIALGLGAVLTHAGHFKERVALGLGGLSASLLGAVFLLRIEMPWPPLLQACLIAAVQGMMTLLFQLVDSKNGKFVNSTFTSFLLRALPPLGVCVFFWFGTTPGVVVMGILFVASLVLASREFSQGQPPLASA